jgi:hypothetical protein
MSTIEAIGQLINNLVGICVVAVLCASVFYAIVDSLRK